MRPLLLIVAAAVGGLAREATSQAPCVSSGAPVSTYFACPFEAGFTSILGQPGTTTVAFANCADNVATAAGAAAPLPFPFSYFGTAVSFATVSTNGLMTLVATNVAGQTSAVNHAFPSGVTPNGVVAPFWDDLGTGPPASATTIAVLSTPASLVVEWNNLKAYSLASAGGAPGTSGSLTFQVALFPTGVIEFRYGPFTAPAAAGCPPFAADACGTAIGLAQSGLTATIGLENSTGATGIDGTGFAAANPAPPQFNLRFTPTSTAPVAVGYTTTPTGTGVTSIVGLGGTTTLPPVAGPSATIACPPCYGNGSSSRLPASGSQPLPWRFTLFNAVSATFNASPNGVVALGDGICADMTANADAGSNALPNNFIAPWWDDQEGRNTSFVGWQVAGLPGARTMTFEWNDLGRQTGTAGDCTTTGDHATFQVVLSEMSDSIEMRYDQAGFVGTGFTATSAALEGVTGVDIVEPFPGPSLATVPFNNLVHTPCLCGTVRYYGDGCAGTGGIVPRIGTTRTPPRIGNAAFGVTLTGAAPSAICILALSASAAPPGGVPLLPGCGTFVGVDATLLLLNAGVTTPGGVGQGTRCLLTPIPFDPALACASAYAQWAVIDPGSANGLAAFSDAIRTVITL